VARLCCIRCSPNAINGKKNGAHNADTKNNIFLGPYWGENGGTWSATNISKPVVSKAKLMKVAPRAEVKKRGPKISFGMRRTKSPTAIAMKTCGS
jgi:hypothetical protein